MKTIVLLTVILLGSFPLYAQESIKGLWNTGQENTVIEITHTDNTIEGKIASSDNIEAPIGQLIVKDISLKNNVYKGKLFSIKRRKWLNATFKNEGEQLVIKVSAGLRKRTVKWDKAN